jgi:hypothetical protein
MRTRERFWSIQQTGRRPRDRDKHQVRCAFMKGSTLCELPHTGMQEAGTLFSCELSYA